MYQEEIVLYATARSRSCRRARRLLERMGYAFEEVDVADGGLRVSLIETTGRKTLLLVFLGGVWWAASERSGRSSVRATWIAWYGAGCRRSKLAWEQVTREE